MGSRGRPRRAETDAAINAATRSMLVEVGYGGLTIEGVARRAEVGKPTVYRRHGSKAALVSAALLDTLEAANPEPPDTGDVNRDTRTLLGNLAALLTSTDFGTALIEIVSPATRDAHLAELFDATVEERRVVIRSLLQRAQDQSRLACEDVETGIDLVLGAIYFRHLLTRGAIDEGFIAEIVDTIIPAGK